MPRRYASLRTEYAAITQGAALVDRSPMGRLRVRGKDALDLLNRLSTNALLELDPGTIIQTVLTTNKGRIIDLLVVAHMDDHVLLLTSPQRRRKVAQWIDTYTFVEEVAVEDVTETTAMLGVIGPKAAETLRMALGEEVAGLIPNSWRTEREGDMNLPVLRTDPLGIPGYDLITTPDHAPSLWRALRETGAIPVGWAALEAVRIERGVPLYGRELGEEFNPLEARLGHAVSFNKECYIGQEVVARLNTYDKVQRLLVALKVDGGARVPADGKVFADGKQVGVITSAARPPGKRKARALAYLRKPYARPGTRVQIEWNGASLEAQVEKSPFAS